MKETYKIKFKIDNDVLRGYVDTINSIKEPINKIKSKLSELNKNDNERCKYIFVMSNNINMFLINNPNDRFKIFNDVIIQLMIVNNGMLTTRMIELLSINRRYLSIMVDNKIIEKESRGIYLLTNKFVDSFYSFQQKYKKAVFSHMNALYFYGMTEEIPYNYTVSVPQRYHVDSVNKKCIVFYVSDSFYDIGLIEVETPSGNKVMAYDKERCICDIIRSKNRMDFEQVKKVIRQYVQSKDKDLVKLSDYSKRMGINNKVMEMVGILNYD